MRSASDRRSTAYHEAGHAVVGHALSIRIGRVTINPTASFRGHTAARVYESELFSPTHIIFCLAGPYAQQRAMRTGWLYAALDGGADDWESAAEAMKRLGCGSRDELAFERMTRKIVKQLWPVIDSFARLLLQGTGEIAEHQVLELLESLLGQKAEYHDAVLRVHRFQALYAERYVTAQNAFYAERYVKA